MPPLLELQAVGGVGDEIGIRLVVAELVRVLQPGAQRPVLAIADDLGPGRLLQGLDAGHGQRHEQQRAGEPPHDVEGLAHLPRYSMYPLTSMMTCAVPAGARRTPTSPLVPRATIPLFARVCPALKLMVDVVGAGVPPGNSLTLPLEVVPVTVTLNEMARAVERDAAVQPTTANVRGTPPTSGAPGAGLRVSTIRHGVTV